ncbi:MAG: M14-type cytosolic carboxypeptidase [Acidobacteriota bacterium]|nr:M14-type cytosolic carboxypeptidase [Acidobacteriota bacterium]
MNISSGFDGGNITCLSCEDPGDIRLEIKKDNQSHFYQWFYFRLTGAKDTPCTLKITNAGGAAYTEGYEDYKAVASYDRDTWFRVETRFDGKELSIHHEPEENAVYYAYFAPYSMERHADLVASALGSPLVDLLHAGHTLDGQDMDVLKIGEDGDDKKVCWFIARQHPGETMAEWWMEGFLDRLLDEDDPICRDLLRRFVFYVVPNMNPDGSRRGYLRTNAVGANLNREWVDASMERSPEVFAIRGLMEQTGVHFFLDVHGDEGLPYNFISGMEGLPSWNDEAEAQQQAFLDALLQASPDFQTEHGYPVDPPGEANLTMASNYVGETFKCLALTLEMPFKDTVDTPNQIQGWSPERSRRFGAACLNALYTIREEL